MSYTVKPGLYAVGSPDKYSDIFVSANYKMSFDCLRQSLSGINAWILVLDTKGVNVWCAAGKGNFGTEELINRVAITRLKEVVVIRRLIVPQLGAPGVSGYEVHHQTGFKVKFGPVRAEDITAWLASDRVATPAMRRVRFLFKDRIILTPVEIVSGLKWLGLGMLVLLLLSGLYPGGFSFARLVTDGMLSAALMLIAYLSGALLGPILLPWLPGRSFSAKGGWAGLLVTLGIVLWLRSFGGWPTSLFVTFAWLLLIPAISSFVLMNFTGSSTYTSFSGVKKELHLAIRFQATAGLLGLVLWIAGRFV
jgi:acetyl-CoA decarbonylase/synthase complex subunit gamma